MPQTLSELTRAEIDKRINARDFEIAQDRVGELRRKVERLSVSPDDDVVVRLNRILEDVAAIPREVHCQLGGLQPVAGEYRYFATGITSTALAQVTGADQRRLAALKAAKQELEAAEAHLATFTE